MFINPLKRAAAKKRILQLLDSREEGNFIGEVKSIGVIVDDKNVKALEDLHTLKANMGIPDDKFYAVIFSAKRKTGKDFDTLHYCLNDIDLKAEIQNAELKKFAVEGVDLLITFAAESNTPVHLLTAYCRAGLKVGRYRQNIPLYDLVIGTEEPSVFKEELLKYLKRIKRT